MSIKAMKLALESLGVIRASCSAGHMIHADNEAAITERILRTAIAEAERLEAERIRPKGKSWLTVNPEGNIEMREIK
jgi:hypothetical protein